MATALTYDPKQQFLGTLAPASSMKTTTASSTLKNNVFNSPIVSASPSATQPVAPKPAATVAATPAKSQYIASLGQGSTPATPATSGTGSTFTTPSGAVVNTTTGALVSGPPVQQPTPAVAPASSTAPTSTMTQPQNNGYETAFNDYIKSLTPSAEEDEASKYLRDILDKSRREEASALERGETLGFATGEAARVNKARAFDIQAASEALDALTNRRKLTTDAQQARVNYEKTLRDDARADSVAAAKETGGFSVSEGEKRYEYDDATKQYKLVATGGPKTYAPSSTAGTASERAAQGKTNAFSLINQLVKPGVKDAETGVPYIDQNGYITPTALKSLMEAALEDNITRKEFLDQYGSYLWPGDDGTYSAYGLTLQDKKALTGL